jgi:hypothetical protein
MLIPPTLAAYRQFILYSADKKPRSPHTGQVADPHDPAQWVTAAEAEQAATRLGLGVGFVFTANDPLFFLDIDHALQPDNTWSPLAADLCRQFKGCYVEVSASGHGLHIIGTTPPITHGCRNQSLGLELYSHGRYCALTGTHAVGDPAHQADLTALLALPGWSGGGTDPDAPPAEWTTGPDPEYTGPEDDADLLQRMLASRSPTGAFSNRASIPDLWNANADALALAYPSGSEASRLEYGYDHSSADAALCQHLAFWTGKDCERIDRLFRQSALYRDKWERVGYMRDTVLHAVGHCRAVYTYTAQTDTPATAAAPARPSAVRRNDPSEATPTEPGYTGLRDGMQLLSVPSQVDYFKGCVYIRSLQKAWVPDGELLKPEQFKSSWGGYTFSLDMINDKTTRNAWEALTENMGYNFPKAHDACFRPELEPGAVIEEEGRTVVNTYKPIVTECRPGDPSRFLRHLALMLPDRSDQAILLAYMAALVQNPGVKFQWCPLIQGMEGNGKSLLIRVLAFAVGHRYSHMPNAKDIDNKFNAWIRNKLFIGVEEIYTADRQDKIDALKPLITNDRVDIQGKGDNQVTGDNRANFLMCSNHKDAVRKTLSDRRYCVFYTAQQEPGDIQAAGMHSDYFPDLYDWLRDEGYAIVNGYLRGYQVPAELNPATHCQTAPPTSSTAEAIRCSMGGIEQEIMEAIEEGRPGFAGGWVSSIAFDRLLEDRRAGAKIPRGKRRELLRGLGYDWHPALPDGRVNNPLIEGGQTGRPRLYIKDGHPLADLQRPHEVVRLYQEAQAAGLGSSLAASAFTTTGGAA